MGITGSCGALDAEEEIKFAANSFTQNSLHYPFILTGPQPSIDRSSSNGFRCISTLTDDTTLSTLSDPITRDFRDYYNEKPVNDKTFNIFLRQYTYDKSPLNTETLIVGDTGIWKIEKVAIDAGYNDERFDIYLFIPKDVQPPYQPIIFFPGASTTILNKFDNKMELWTPYFIIKSDRLLAYPIYKGTFERRDGFNSTNPEETTLYRDQVIMWRKDVGRTIDYFETRNDILYDKVGYFGFSWGGIMGAIIPAVEKRITVVINYAGGMKMTHAFPEVDQINFLPRIHQPFLKLNGKYDMYFPVETSQITMYKLLGTASNDKNRIIYDTGHMIPENELIKDSLNWLDKYLGPVK